MAKQSACVQLRQATVRQRWCGVVCLCVAGSLEWLEACSLYDSLSYHTVPNSPAQVML